MADAMLCPRSETVRVAETGKVISSVVAVVTDYCCDLG